jgi:signal transduction histidine kinase
MRRGPLPFLLFLLAAGGTLFLATRILASERVSAEQTARERLRATTREAEGVLFGAGLAAIHATPSAIAQVDWISDRGSGRLRFITPQEPASLDRLRLGHDPTAVSYLAAAERAEAVDGDIARAADLYRAVAAGSADPGARCAALFRLAALERRQDRPDAAQRLEGDFLERLPAADRGTLEAVIVRARASRPDPELAPCLLAAVGSPDESIALGLLAQVDPRCRESVKTRREELRSMERLRPLAEGAWEGSTVREGAAIREGRLVAWRRGEGLTVCVHEEAVPTLPPGIRLAPGSDGLPRDEEITESLEIGRPFRGVSVAASVPRSAVEAEARRGAWLLGGALVALLLAGGAALVLSVRAARREAEAARARADFVTKVGHDLRTPLAVVRMYAETLAAGRVADPAEAREFAGVAAREAARLTDMVGQVLDLSRVSEGDGALARRPLDLAALVREVAEVHRPLLEHVGLRFEMRAAEPLPVLGDSSALRGAVSNLLENAERHAAAGGSVEIEARRDGRMAEVRVLDRGPGVPEGMEERVFERFVRGPDAACPGAGLGLALVREAAEAHGGAASASNRQGGGAAFSLALPIREGGA